MKRLGKVAGVNPVLIVAAKDSGDLDRGREFLGEAGASALGTITGVVILAEENILSIGLAGRPLDPTSRVNGITEGGLLEDNAGILCPGAAEVVASLSNILTRSSIDSGLVDHVVSLIGAGGTALSGDSTFRVLKETNVTAVKPAHSGLTENEVDGTLDVALAIHLVAGLGEDSVYAVSE